MRLNHSTHLAAAFIATCLAACQEPGAAPNLPPGQTNVVGSKDLHALYDDKTWDWGDGGGYFAKSGDFSAWTQPDGKSAYATGFWWVNDQGGVCFDGYWRTKDGAHSNITCFNHRTDGKVWYQRRDPSGPWYIFKSDPVRQSDESEKLKAGDQVEAKLGELKTEIGKGGS